MSVRSVCISQFRSPVLLVVSDNEVYDIKGACERIFSLKMGSIVVYSGWLGILIDFKTEGETIKENQVMSAAGVCASSNNRTEYRGVLRARCETSGNARDCRLLNLTTGRAFVESFVPPVAGSEVTLHFRLPNGHQICASGVVTHHQFKVGFDVDFTELSVNDREQISGLLV